MGCGSCGTGDGAAPGCKSNGNCGLACGKMSVYDWLGDMDLPSHERFNITEIKFKGGKKGYFKNTQNLELYAGDPVVVDMQNGHHIGHVSLQGEIVRLQMLKKNIEEEDPEVKEILRKATNKDLEKFARVKQREMPTLYRTRQIIQDTKLQMKLSDVEYQADNTKATFYYSADDRVDFRELIKILASEFKIRVEMRQISLRQEASRLGGIGSCGRELCCSTWLSEFKSVTTMAARYQNLSLNPSKLSGQCGRLKCCLNYELETYLDALIDIPQIDKPIRTQRGDASLQKVDIFKKVLWFSYENETTWVPVSAERVKEILSLIDKGVKITSLQDDEVFTKEHKSKLGEAVEKLERKRLIRQKAIRKASNEPTEEDKPQKSDRQRGRRQRGNVSGSTERQGTNRRGDRSTRQDQNSKRPNRRKPNDQVTSTDNKGAEATPHHKRRALPKEKVENKNTPKKVEQQPESKSRPKKWGGKGNSQKQGQKPTQAKGNPQKQTPEKKAPNRPNRRRKPSNRKPTDSK
ncbi:PSP1 domain-containing protein [Sediminitomix flava]|uniref:Cell fate regulator YaaT (PSP1 superfamily) n=1 Tax=Sediminitomix flava TaxID=379075 RepID=A0A315ZA87_SEDFL|nr:regulatory iron-sulfur-containing complex subunit RicT [Sediminitomix flava]PWJ42495.1 cell fate regulator YaaT (PSP1 superfamily) [Sediminitomix flava]